MDIGYVFEGTAIGTIKRAVPVDINLRGSSGWIAKGGFVCATLESVRHWYTEFEHNMISNVRPGV